MIQASISRFFYMVTTIPEMCGNTTVVFHLDKTKPKMEDMFIEKNSVRYYRLLRPL